MCGTPFLQIGMSLEPQNRLRTLQAGNPRLLQIVSTWALRDMRSTEMSIHQNYNSKRVENEIVREWFDFGQETASGAEGLLEDV